MPTAVCPHCGFECPDVEPGAAVKCVGCSREFVHGEQGQSPGNKLAPRATWQRGKPRRPRRREDERLQQIHRSTRIPAIAFLVTWILASCLGLFFVACSAYLLFVPDAREDRGPLAKLSTGEKTIVAVGGSYAVVVPVGLYGAVCMLRGRNHRWAVASAVLLLVGFIMCWPAVGIAIWVLVVLNRSQVRTASDSRPDDF